MKTNEANIFVFIASIIVGVLIAFNISFNSDNHWIFLNSSQYEEAYSYKMKLSNEINSLMDVYNKDNVKLKKYKSQDKSQVIQDMKNEINQNKMVIGETDLEGEGIKITLNDAENWNTDDYTREQLIHDSDVACVLNDLKNAGAEAIAINGQRITDRSSVTCEWAFLEVNGIKEPAPFYIEAIGNKVGLEQYMNKPESYLKYLSGPLRGVWVSIEQSDHIKIPAYNDEIITKYASESKKSSSK